MLTAEESLSPGEVQLTGIHFAMCMCSVLKLCLLSVQACQDSVAEARRDADSLSTRHRQLRPTKYRDHAIKFLLCVAEERHDMDSLFTRHSQLHPTKFRDHAFKFLLCVTDAGLCTGVSGQCRGGKA